MKLITIISCIALFLLGCENVAETETQSQLLELREIPAVYFTIDEVSFDNKKSRWLGTDSSLVSGYVLELYPDGTPYKKFGVVDGKKMGEQITWFPDGKIQFLETFNENRMHGVVKRWTREEGYQLVAELNYYEGRLHGKQLKWYTTGEVHKIMNLHHGKEEGMQQAFRKNGALYANYEALNGRVFGLKRSNLCYELKNEEIIFQQ